MPIREQETDALIGFLNELLWLDPDFVSQLLNKRVPCNKEIADHPTVQVWCEDDGIPAGTFEASILGVLNGFCGKFDDGPRKDWGPITITTDKTGRILGITRTVNGVCSVCSGTVINDGTLRAGEDLKCKKCREEATTK